MNRSDDSIDGARPAPPFWVSAASRLIPRLPAGRYRAMNFVASRRVEPFWTELPPDLGALEYRCNLADALMREVCLTGRYEPQETALVRRLLHAGATFVDVGANWGYFTLVGAHQTGAAGRVVSIEADPRACRTIAANVARNRLTHVTVVECAASDADASLVFGEYQPGADRSGNFGFAQTSTIREGSPRHHVRARRLDDVLDEAGVREVDVLKMDIEGGEARALAGLERRLRGGAVRWILLELHPRHLLDLGSSSDQVVACLRHHGFHASLIDHSPRAHRRAAAGRLDAFDVLSPLAAGADLGPWPHVLFMRDHAASS